MLVRINGTREELSEKITNLEELIAKMDLKPERIVIEHNHTVIPRDTWPDTRIQDNDSIEIVSFVGGG